MANVSEKAQILRYWECVEFFTPQSLPEKDPRHATFPVYLVSGIKPFPWENGHAHQTRRIDRNLGWRYTLFLVPINVAALRDDLEERIGSQESETARDERPAEKAALFTIGVDRNGLMVPESLLVSSIGWAYSELIRTENPRGLEASKFSSYQDDVAYLFDERYAGSSATHRNIDALNTDMLDLLALPQSFVSSEHVTVQAVAKALSEEERLREKTREQKAQARSNNSQVPIQDVEPEISIEEETPVDLLNSMFLGELASVAGAVERNEYGKALGSYLGDKPKEQQDIRAKLDGAWKVLHPSLFPEGRWPGKGRYPLVFSQQVAVNLAFRELQPASGLMAVNGPPGTGKTTLLKDILAGVITRRAMAMAKFDDPEKAFQGSHVAYHTDKFTHRYGDLHPSLKGFGMAVASANNAAVENVTLEFPRASDVDPEWGERSSPFGDLASTLLGEKAWTLISTKLGNKNNRSQFFTEFWIDLKPREGEPPPKPKAGKIIRESKLGLSDWKGAVDTFKRALANEQVIRKERVRLYQEIAEKGLLEKKIAKRLSEVGGLERAISTAKIVVSKARQETESVMALKSIAEKDAKGIQASRPHSIWFLINHIVKMEKVTRWQSELTNANDQVRLYGIQLQQATLDYEEAMSGQRRSMATYIAHKEQTEVLQRQVSAIGQRAQAYKHRHDKHYPDLRRVANDDTYRELLSPFDDAEWNEARVKVFLTALTLHEVFLQVARKSASKNIGLALAMINGDAPGDVPIAAARAAWDTFFMLVPLVSSTFASFHRLFKDLKHEDIGWLLIDEAGQAAPQQAAGAIWRSRRVMVVGDPIQLEPIVGVPYSLQSCLRQPYKVAEQWTPGLRSAQELADAGSQYGSQIGKLWVGAPLLVHRRCDDPMFTICNRIAYNGAMVNGKPSSKENSGLQSQWLHVAGDEASGHWLAEEGRELDRLLARLIERGISPADIFLISPFRSVVEQLRKRALPNSGYAGMQAGTIHTVQGKEAKVVILVLGGNPSRQGAKQWASESPNLLNVAASRAKSYLYIIGNRREWEKYPYFREASDAIA